MLIVIVTYAPIVVMLVLSFNTGRGITFPLQGVGTDWYGTVLNSSAIGQALIRSLELALSVTAVVVVITTLTALALRENFRGKDALFYIIMLGMIIPGVVYGIGAEYMYRLLGVNLSLWTALPINVIWSLPFGLLLMLARFDPQLLDYEHAASTLGASRWRVFRDVTFPLIYNQVVATAFFGFTLSFDELMRSVFVVGGPPTLSLYVFSVIGNQTLTPEYFALGGLVTGVSVVMVILIGVFMSRGYGKKLF
jgi:putative spermidine/putrescine transport system permease protein